jgi:hypothetical protein
MRTWFLVLGVLSLSLPAPAWAQDGQKSDSGKNAPKTLRAGAADSNITPPLGQPIVGNFTIPSATHIHDELHARCLVLDDGRTKIAFAVCDNVGIPREVFDEARRMIAEETDLPEDHILMSATHTHSATSARSPNALVPNKTPTAYQQFLARRIADGVRRALNNLEPAEIAWGSVDVPDQVFCRRWLLKPGTPNLSPYGDQEKVRMNPPRASDTLLKPASPTDPQVSFLSVRSKDGRPIALLANYSLHYVGGVPTGHVSADYYGVFARKITEKLGAEKLDPPFVGIMSNGTSGNINNINFRVKAERKSSYEKMREVADEVAEAVAEAASKVKYQDWVPLDASKTELVLAVRKPTEEQLKKAREVLARPEDAPSEYRLQRPYAARAVQLHESPDEVSVPLQAFRIGDLGIDAIPFEVFTETGLAIKKKSPFKQTFTIELANGSYGYLPTPEQHALGGYETWLGTNKVEIQASDKIEKVVLDLLKGLKEKTNSQARN